MNVGMCERDWRRLLLQDEQDGNKGGRTFYSNPVNCNE